MKIDGSYYKTIRNTFVYGGAERYNSVSASTDINTTQLRGDTVEISDDAINMEKAGNREISREEKISILQKQVQNGTYRYNIEAIADKIMERIA